MPTTWSDDFTHDYFADSTYALVAGTEGTDFTVAPNTLTAAIPPAGTLVGWQDQRTAQTFPFSQTIYFTTYPSDDPSSGINHTFAFGWQPSPSTAIIEVEIAPASGGGNNWQIAGLSAADPSDDFDIVVPFTIPSAPWHVSLSVDISGNVTALTSDGQTITHTMAPALLLALESVSFFPTVVFETITGGGAPAPWVVNRWTYESGSPPPSNPIFTCNATTSTGPFSIAQYNWTFDDDTYQSGPIIQKEYELGSGDHAIFLTVTDASGRRASVTHTVTA
jgi:hypothetical protein